MSKKITQAEAFGAIPRTIRNYNRRVVLNAVREKKEFSIAEIASEVMLSRQSVMKAVQYFIDKKVIVSLGKGASTETGGKRPEMYALSPVQKILVILQRTEELRFTLMDLFANELDAVSVPITKELTDEGFRDALVEGKSRIEKRNPEDALLIYGVSMAMGGLVELENQSLHRSMYFSKLSVGLPVHGILSEIFPKVSCVIVDNIGRMAGYSVMCENPEVTEKNRRILTLYMDRAITGAFFVDGAIQDGTVQMMIEAGHMILDPHDQEVCTCGNCGCAEQLVSLGRVRREIQKKLERYPDSMLSKLTHSKIQYRTVFEGGRAGDPACLEETERLAKVMGQFLRNLLLACRPEIVVFIGNLAGADERFDRILRETLRNDWVYSLRGGTFELCYERRELAVLETLGSAQAVIKAFYNDEELYGREEEGT